MVYLVGEVPVAVAIGLCRGGLDKQCAILAHLIIGVVERINVDGKSAGMLRQIGRASDTSITETRRVVVAHLGLVVGIIHIGQ